MKLWTSQMVEAFGGEVCGLAVPTVAILLLNAGAMDMRILNWLQMLVVPVLGLLGFRIDLRWNEHEGERNASKRNPEVPHYVCL
jgi:hypothetical protein